MFSVWVVRYKGERGGMTRRYERTASSRTHGNGRLAVISAVNRMTRIHSFLVLAAICVVVADDGQEERANTDVALFEFDLVDECKYTAEAEWAFRTRSDLPGSVLEDKVSDVRYRK